MGFNLAFQGLTDVEQFFIVTCNKSMDSCKHGNETDLRFTWQWLWRLLTFGC